MKEGVHVQSGEGEAANLIRKCVKFWPNLISNVYPSIFNLILTSKLKVKKIGEIEVDGVCVGCCMQHVSQRFSTSGPLFFPHVNAYTYTNNVSYLTAIFKSHHIEWNDFKFW